MVGVVCSWYLLCRFGMSQVDYAKLCILSAVGGKFQVEFNLYEAGVSTGSIKVSLDIPQQILNESVRKL